MKYSINPDVVLVTVLDESMFVYVNSSQGSIESMRSTNETGAYLWSLLEQGMEIEDIVANVTRDYEISRDEAESVCMAFIRSLIEAGYITTEE